MLTPKDIETKVFKISFRGYEVSEVDDFLQEICDSYIEIYTENKKYQAQIGRLSDAVAQYKSMEETITDAVTVADKSAGEIETEARQKADEIIKNAELTADSIVAGAEQKIADEAYRLDSIKREIEIYKNKIIELLNAQLSVLKEYPQSGNFGSNLTNTHTQQLWMRKSAELNDTKVFNEVKNTSEKVSQNSENTKASDENMKALKKNKKAFKNTEKTVKKYKEESSVSEDTMPIEAFNADEAADKTINNTVEKSTQDLPLVSVNDKGEYVVSDQ